MTDVHTEGPTPRKPLRLWPGIIVVALQWVLWLVLPLVAPDAGMYGTIGGVLCGLIVAVWWLIFSRAAWVERLGAVALMVLALIATKRLVHPSIANGMLGMMVFIYAIPALSLALVLWAVATRRLADGWRRASMVIAILLACGVFALIRTGGVAGGGAADFHWRWTPTPEERLLSQARQEQLAPVPSAAAEPAHPAAGSGLTPAAGEKPGTAVAAAATAPSTPVPMAPPPAWPGFRGLNRDGVVRGVAIETDWAKFPPAPIWRKPVGPGWSSFAISGDLFYTQEQRGESELVSCYRLSTGEPVWRHSDAVRFYESNGGAGPRATPTLDGGRVYSFGATGILNALDAATGAVVWSRDVASDSATKVPIWGFSSSPLVVDATVIVAAAGKLAAYDLATGKPRWFGPEHGGGYSSPQLATFDGAAQVLLLSDAGATSVAPATGAVLWEYPWPGAAVVQPASIAGGDVLVSTASAAGGIGMRRLAIAHGSGGWTVSERWTSTGLKPYFNDSVVHKGFVYGFDGAILSCIDLADGTRKWKGGRYGNGQMVLLPGQDVLLVISEDGDLALVSAAPDQFREIARVPVLNGKTWNHPAVAGDVLLVRNGEEMAAFRLKTIRPQD